MTTTIGLLGDRDLSYITHRELEAAVQLLPDGVEVAWIPTDSPDAVAQAAGVDGLWAIPGTPYRNDDNVYAALTGARVNGQPFLGTCGGFQYAAIEFAKNVVGLTTAAHAEVDASAEFKVVDALSCSLVAQEREVIVEAGTALASIVGTTPFMGYHYCNYGLSESYLDQLTEHGFEFLLAPSMLVWKPLRSPDIRSSSPRSFNHKWAVLTASRLAR